MDPTRGPLGRLGAASVTSGQCSYSPGCCAYSPPHSAAPRSTRSRDPRVDWVNSHWSTGNPALLSDDRHSALFHIRLTGDENTMLSAAHEVVPEWRRGAPDFRLAVTGEAQIAHHAAKAKDGDDSPTPSCAGPCSPASPRS